MHILRLLGLAVAAAILIAACGGDTADDPAPDDSESTTSITETSTTTMAGGGTPSTTTADGTGGDAIEVDANALPTAPSGLDALAGNWCSLYDVGNLDAFFLGSGELAEEEPFADACRWSVAGLPNSHYITVGLGAFDSEVAFIQSGLDGEEKEEATYNGTTVWIQRGPDTKAFIETPDGRYISVEIHGEFGGPGGFWRDSLHYLDPALDALLNNITSRL